MRIFKSGVAKDLFKNYMIGHIVLIIVMFIVVSFSVVSMVMWNVTPSVNGFKDINTKLMSNYKEITVEELEEVKGFVIVVNENDKVEYKIGHVIEEFEEVTIRDYIKIINPSRLETTSFLKEFEAMNTMEMGMATIIINSENEEEYSISYRVIEGENKLIIFGVPYETLYKYNKFDWITEGKRDLISVLVFDGLILILLVYLFARITSKKFVKPIVVLKEGMKDLTNGDYGRQLVVKSKNEFKELADGFNLMSTTIKEEKEENERLQQERNKLILYISHDLKNPLAAVLGYSEILSESENLSYEEKLEYLNIISKNSKRANKIITDLFDLSIIESNDYKLNAKEVDINEVLREIVADYIPELEKKAFKYEFNISEDEHLILIDEVKFTRAISNLIDNSIKYNNENTTLTIESKIDLDKIEIIISDNGKGISEEAREKIFEVFMREDKARNSQTGGTGIGLAITKAVIEKHGGTIKLMDSEKGVSYKINI
ncbi:MAG: ATP-binding protein [Clostridium sp.]